MVCLGRLEAESCCKLFRHLFVPLHLQRDCKGWEGDAALLPPPEVDGDPIVAGEGVHLPLARHELPLFLDGQPLSYDSYFNGVVEYYRIHLKCSKHAGCGKFRGLGSNQCKMLGRREPLAFLKAWHRLKDADGVVTAKDHKSRVPTVEQVRACADAAVG